MGHAKSKQKIDVLIDLKPKTNNIVEDYEILDKKLGVGVNGSVLQCIDRVTRVEYALKILADCAKSRREIVLHVKACQDSPYIVQIIDVYENSHKGKKIFCIVMECMKGGELFEKITSRIKNKQPFTEKEIAKLMFQISSAVKHLHDLNIAHRDLKPENLLLTSTDDDATIKLIDFGFAKEVAFGLKTPCYTPYYVAPEVLGSYKYDKSCDIWSLGVIMYILCCGYPPFYSEHSESISPGMKKKIRAGDYKFPEKEWSKISSDAKELINGMITPTPEKRLSINEIMENKWISKHIDVPETILPGNAILEDDIDNLPDILNEFSRGLSEMRGFDYENNIQIKDLDSSNNDLMRKRLEKRVNLNKINEESQKSKDQNNDSLSPSNVDSNLKNDQKVDTENNFE